MCELGGQQQAVVVNLQKAERQYLCGSEETCYLVLPVDLCSSEVPSKTKLDHLSNKQYKRLGK